MKNLLLILSAIVVFQSHSQTEKRTYNCYFDFNKADFSEDSVARLVKWMDGVEYSQIRSVTLRSFTDSVGSQTYNYKLADRRLKAVYRYLLRAYPDLAIVSDPKGEVYSNAYGTNDSHWRKVEVEMTFVPKPVVAEIPPVVIIEDKLELVQQLPEPKRAETKEERIETFSKAKGAIKLEVQFYGGTANYMGNAAADVEALAAYLNEHPEVDALIRGHVCCQNDMQLSERRAKKVYSDLIALGISKRRLKYEGFGNTMPVAREVDEYSMQQNRRVDVVFTPEK